MGRLDIGAITLNVRDTGEGPTFIFIPGLVGLLDAWHYQLEHFASRFRCIAFDHRGAGNSDQPVAPGSYSTDILARDVIALMDHLAIERAHVAGTSTGGCVLQNLALDFPDRIGVCIFNNTWVTADEFVRRVQTTRKRIALHYGPEEYVRVSSMFTSGALQFRNNLDKVMELENRALETIAPVEVLSQRIDMTLAHDRSAELANIVNPSLVIGTMDDATVPFYFTGDLHAAIPGAQKYVFEEGGHYSYRRHPETWNRVVDGFLKDAIHAQGNKQTDNKTIQGLRP